MGFFFAFTPGFCINVLKKAFVFLYVFAANNI